MPSVVSFLEDQSSAVTSWRPSGHSKAFTLAGVGTNLHLLSEDLEIIQSVSLPIADRITRLVGLSEHSSIFYSGTDGSIGFISCCSGKLGKANPASSPAAVGYDVGIDSDIHRTGHLASVLFNSSSGGSCALIDTQRDSVIGRIPLGQTGTPNAMRIVDTSMMCVASGIVSLYDVRTSQAKAGSATKVLKCQGAAGRVFTSIESDGGHSVIGGDSVGGLWLWDTRKEDSPLKSVHAHAGAVLSLSLGGGIVGSSSTDGSISLWTVFSPEHQPKKRTRKLLLDDSTGPLKRCAVEGSGVATAVCIEDATDAERHVSYITDAGVVVLTQVADWH
jgi:hypothetical protein